MHGKAFRHYYGYYPTSLLFGAKAVAARKMAVLEELARRLPEIAKILIMLSFASKFLRFPKNS